MTPAPRYRPRVIPAMRLPPGLRHGARRAAVAWRSATGFLASALASLWLLSLLTGCVSPPTVPPERVAAAVAASNAGAKQLPATARRIEITGPRGRLSRGEREALLRRLSAEGNASLMQRHLAAMSAFGDVDLYAGNQVRLLIDGPSTFEAMFAAIDAARHSVLIETYIVEDTAVANRFADALVRKRAQGLQVILLYDAVGSIRTDGAYFDALKKAGVAVCPYNPLNPAKKKTDQSPLHRDHRKIIVVDRQVAFTGGINISAVYTSGSSIGSNRGRGPSGGVVSGAGAAEAGWRDTHVEIRGPAAAGFEDLVRSAWREQGCEGGVAVPAQLPKLPRGSGKDVVRIVPSRPDDDYSRIYAMLMTAIDVSRKSVHLTMAYFAPGDEMVAALCEAAQRGVDVQLVLPSRSDFPPVLHAGRSYYERMLAAGVRIHELQGAVLHAKTGVIDGVFSTVGSSNLDYRSFAGNNEINAVILGDDFGDEMAAMFRQDLAASHEISLASWRSRPLSQRLKELAGRALESWW